MPQDSRRTRAEKRGEVKSSEALIGAVRTTRAVIESSGEGEQELEIPEDSSEDSKMENNLEAVKEMGRLMGDCMNRQIDVQRERDNKNEERYRQREEKTEERFRQLIKEQQRSHREDTEVLAGQFKRMRMEMESSRGRITQKIPSFDGTNIEFDDWQDKVEAVMTWNMLDLIKLLQLLPTCIAGQAKRSFDSLTDEDKQTKDSFFQAMRKKLDPRSESRNKELFIAAKKNEGESIMCFVDRCRMHIRRSGSDPMEPFVIALLRLKVVECLPTIERKIFDATTDPNESLDSTIHRADTMLSIDCRSRSDNENKYSSKFKTNVDNGSGTRQGHINQNDNLTESCWRCNQPGHNKRHCPLIKRPVRKGDYGVRSGQESNSANENLMLGNLSNSPPGEEIQISLAQSDHQYQNINQSNSES